MIVPKLAAVSKVLSKAVVPFSILFKGSGNADIAGSLKYRGEKISLTYRNKQNKVTLSFT